MYSVSNAYKTKMLSQIQTHALSGTIGSVSFTGEDVIGVSYTNKCSDKKVSIGGVNVGTLKLTFLHDILERGDYRGKTITLSDSLLTGYDANNDPVWETVPIGTFYVGEATWRAEGMVDVVAYDCISKTDKTLEITTSNGTIYEWSKFIELKTGAVFGMTEEECEALPNGTEILTPYAFHKMGTYRDLINALAQMVGGFAYAAKDGTWKFKNYGSDPVLTIAKNRRFKGAKYSDFTTLYDAVSFTRARDGVQIVCGSARGVTMDLGENPFLQYGGARMVWDMAESIVNAILPMRYIPYDVSLLPALICLDLGDVVSFSTDYADATTLGAVMDVTWVYNKSFTIRCYGDNPDIYKVESQAKKNLSGISKQVAQNNITYYIYSNTQAYTFGNDVEVEIANLRFTSTEETTVEINHEFIFDMTADLSHSIQYEVRYYLDDELVEYTPYEKLGTGGIQGLLSGSTDFSITRDFFYVLKDVAPNFTHSWKVRIYTKGITSTTIDVDHCHVTLKGQKLYGADEFDGFLEFEDSVHLFDIGGVGMLSMEDSVTFSESPSESNYILTESGDELTTENGDNLIW